MNNIHLKYVNKQDEKIFDNSYYKRLLELPKEYVEKQWANFDWDKAEKFIAHKQMVLAKTAYSKNLTKIKTIQNEIVNSLEARMLSVKKVSENSNSAGIDGVRWRTDYDKMKAVAKLDTSNYQAMPFRNFTLKDKKTNKERNVGIPTLQDRAMHYLWTLALEPVAESWADAKSFGFRKGRGTAHAHAHLMNALTDWETGDWILVGDVHSYYANISHSWLLKNIPMDKNILKQFLKSGIVFPDGNFFPTEEGISLGCSLSPILGNMTLDGLQKELYALQGEKITDYKNGWCLRFADDVVILAKSEKDAMKFRDTLIDFLEKRGLKLSYNKTKILNLNSGDEFTFLSRTYYKKDGIIHCKPSQASKDKFRERFEEFIFNPNKKWTPKKLITEVNQKLNGWASYHRITEAKETFAELDSFVTAVIFRLMQKKYPNYSREEIKRKFYWKASDGRYIFALASNREYKIINLVDVLLIKAKRIETNKNYFIETSYFEKLNEETEIDNITGKYKELWNRQNGKCAICNKMILSNQAKRIIFKRLSKDVSINNMMYIHKFCQESELVYIYGNLGEINARTTMDIINEIQDIEEGNKEKSRPSKFDKLRVYFQNENKNKITLTFSGIEKIIGCKLCKSAYIHKSYFYNHSDERSIANAWVSQKYKITNFDFENKKITFEKEKLNKTKVVIPKFIFNSKLPMEAKYEIEDFFKTIKTKYKL